MLFEAFPRLAVRLRSIFPEADVHLYPECAGLYVSFPNFPSWEVHVKSAPLLGGKEQFQIFESSVSLRFECLQDVGEEDFHRLLAAENLGLRGVSLVADGENGRRAIKVRASYLGQKGRTRDEAESLAIDVVSLLRYCRLLDDRIQRSVGGYSFSFEMYQSTYFRKSLGLTRNINYARTIFTGSSERVFAQVMGTLRDDYGCGIQLGGQEYGASVLVPSSLLDMLFRLPAETPTLSASTVLHLAVGIESQPFALVSRMNGKIGEGHFEISPDGKLISYVAWKHLTNDLRYYALDHLLHLIHEAAAILKAEVHGPQDTAASATSAGERSDRSARILDLTAPLRNAA